jgi:2-amino-4-hydroxy-6-hydroxymethyldihydropteridine diphosphokinase
MEIGLSLGSNLGDRLGFLRAARDAIAALDDVRVVAQSPVYETEPVGVKPEYADLAYLNAVVILATDRAVADVHRDLARIEESHGRVRRGDRFAPRTLDIDVLYAGDLVAATDRLTVPHPRWADRRFVVQPLADVRPGLVLPGMDRPVQSWLNDMPVEPRVTLFAREW